MSLIFGFVQFDHLKSARAPVTVSESLQAKKALLTHVLMFLPQAPTLSVLSLLLYQYSLTR